ncbi:DUF502 domain-containing protein [Candidatus Babeliales bacterium]|nr:DUF502 domain-containing protein [Candidatus Babeliales bacterium]MBP9843628.1 DUF502 domain-containing protein [Candidatus Babeliales bacterium]
MKIILFFQQAYAYLRHLFFKGFLFILPIAITFSLFHFCINLIVSWLVPLRKLHLPFLEIIPYYEIIVVILFILAIGGFLQAFVLKPCIKIMEDIFSQIPLLNSVYFGAKQLIEAFSGQNKTSFKDVVYVEFPRPGIYSIGFLTSEVPTDIAPNREKIYYNVYIPTTPNPTTGFFIVLSKDQFHHANLTRQEAITLIISGGILQPDRYKEEEKNI